MNVIKEEILHRLNQLQIPHHHCEDSWYSCPKSAEGCADETKPKNVCTCGADLHNENVNRIARLLVYL